MWKSLVFFFCLKLFSCKYFSRADRNNILSIHLLMQLMRDFPSGAAGRICLSVQEVQETWVRCLGWEYNLEQEMATHSSVLAWKFHGKRSLVGYSPWGPKALATTEHGHRLGGAAYVPYIYVGFPGHKILGLHLIFLNVLNILPFFFLS